MATEVVRNRYIIRRLYEALCRGDLDVLDDLVAEHVVDHALDERWDGIDGLKEAYASLRSSLAQLDITVGDVVAERDRVAARIVIDGVHHGPLLGVAPTGRRVRVSGIGVARVRGGKVVERWSLVDELGLLQQLGALPPRARWRW